jgi:hypothetical protein
VGVIPGCGKAVGGADGSSAGRNARLR